MMYRRLTFKMDRSRLYERVLLLVFLIFVVALFWFFAFYSPQKKTLNTLKASILEKSKQTHVIEEKRHLIEHLSKDETAKDLLKKIQLTDAERKRIEVEISRYEHRYIGETQLAKLLYDLLHQSEGISILNFSNETNVGSAAQSTPPPTSGVTLQKSIKSSPHPIQSMTKMLYTLVLKGDYFSIMHYLDHMEQSPWEIYWDVFDYQVEAYPLAVLTLQFYTLAGKT